MLQQEFIKETIANEKDINDEIFWNYLKYHRIHCSYQKI